MAAPRIAPVTDPTDEQRELFAPSEAAFGRLLNIFGTLAHHPKLLKSFGRFGTDFLFQGRLPAREREIVILRVGWNCRSVYEFGQHTVIGGQMGLTDREVARAADVANADDPGWSGDDAALVALADELCSTDNVTDETWARLAARWEAPELVELVLLVGYYRLVSGFLNATRVELDPGVPGWPDGARP